MPKLSIILSNYNYGRYLDERFQSLLNQTYTDFELIVVDDGSTDNSTEVIKKYAVDPRIKTRNFTENSGSPFMRRNEVADKALGEYLLFAEADDSCNTTLLERLVEKLDTHPSAGLAYAQSYQIDEEGKIQCSARKWTDHFDKKRWVNDFFDTGIHEMKYLASQNVIPNTSAVMMRKKLFLQVGKFDLSMQLSADWLLWCKLLEISDVAFVAEPLNYFRFHGETVRKKTSLYLLVLEGYRVIAYAGKCLGLSRSNLLKNSDWRTKQWALYIYSSGRSISLRKNWRIYKQAQKISPGIVFPLLKHLACYWWSAYR